MSRAEQLPLTVSDWVDAHRGELAELARRLVRIPSQNGVENERAITDALADVLHRKRLGQVEITGPSPERPSIVATLDGSKPGPTLILTGHTDTKPAGPLDAWEHPPFEGVIKDDLLYGLGSADMKSGVAAIVVAAEALQAVAADWPGRLLLVFTADEENGGQDGLGWLCDHGLRADAALIAEPSGIDRSMDTLALGCRGVLRFSLEFSGTQMHSSMSDRRGAINASHKMARVLVAMAERFRLTHQPDPFFPDDVTYNVGCKVSGGTTSGIVSGRAAFTVDIRTLPSMCADRCLAELNAFLDSLRADDPDLQVELVEIRGNDTWLPGCRIDESHPLVQSMLWAIDAVPGDPIAPGGFPACTDGRYLEAVGVPVIPAFGPGRIEHCHSPQEHVPMADVVRAAKIYAVGAYRYLTTTPPGRPE